MCQSAEAGGGGMAFARGVALQHCGKAGDARQALESAVLGADRNLSLYLTREALASLGN
jgi:hypothetical protein